MKLLSSFQSIPKYYNYETHKIVMKSQITMNKGTQSLQLEIGLPNWSGELFKTYQEEKMASLPKGTLILTKRGTAGIRSSVYPKSKRTPIPIGMKISSARGTATRTL